MKKVLGAMLFVFLMAASDGNAVQIAAVDYIGVVGVGGSAPTGIWKWAVRDNAQDTSIDFWYGYCLEKDKAVYVQDLNFPNLGAELYWNDGYALTAYSSLTNGASLIDTSLMLDVSNAVYFDGIQQAIWSGTSGSFTEFLFKLDSPNLQDWVVYQPTNSVPEPSTMLLLGFGMVGIGVAGKKFRK